MKTCLGFGPFQKHLWVFSFPPTGLLLFYFHSEDSCIVTIVITPHTVPWLSSVNKKLMQSSKAVSYVFFGVEVMLLIALPQKHGIGNTENFTCCSQ